MRNDLRLPDLTFPGVKQSRNEIPWNLNKLLYIGGAAIRSDLVAAAISNGSLGYALPERLDLVKQSHEFMVGKLAGGGSKISAHTQFKLLTIFFRWAEESGYTLSLSTAQTTYIHWTDHLVHRLTVAKTLSPNTVYTMGRVVGQILDHALGREAPMIELTRLKEPKRRKSAKGTKADKQNLESTFAFGRLLQDICDGMTLSAIWGPRPVRIPLQSGGELVQWVGTHYTNKSANFERTPYREQVRVERKEARRIAYENDKSLHIRATLVNLRIVAELLMLIGQTGMNLAQANQLELRHFSYFSDIDSYKVRDYKSRRGGEILFEIFKEYRAHFERYLEWRRTLFPDELRLFPILRSRGADAKSRPSFRSIQKACKASGVVWNPPSILRSTRINWLLRRSGDPELTSEMAQHHKQTLLNNYEIPSQQRAIGEITRFWLNADPMLSKTIPLVAVAPGTCDGIPTAVPSKPKLATSPDCVHPSGCLWCEHHRDIDSFDYVWALSCFRHLKVLEVGRYHPPAGMNHDDHPGDHAITRMSGKLAWFRESNSTRRDWVEESLARVEEGNYHAEWVRLIENVEGAPA